MVWVDSAPPAYSWRGEIHQTPFYSPILVLVCPYIWWQRVRLAKYLATSGCFVDRMNDVQFTEVLTGLLFSVIKFFYPGVFQEEGGGLYAPWPPPKHGTAIYLYMH